MIRRHRHPHAHVLLAALAELSARVTEGLDHSSFADHLQRTLPECAGIHTCDVVSTLDPAPDVPHLRVPLGGLHGDVALQFLMRPGRLPDLDIRAFAQAAGSLAARVCSTPHAAFADGVLDASAVEAFIEATRRFLAGDA